MGDGMSNMDLWNKVSKPPTSALKTIGAGRLKGKSDVNPQWRYQAMTENFGLCGVGWKYTVDRKWTELGSEGQVMCFADVSLYVRVNGEWSDAIPGSGGSMLVELESKGLHTSDEGYKMAVTDALSVAMKMLGVAAEIYLGNFDGSKYKDAQDKGQGSHKPDSPGQLSAVQTSLLKELGEACKGDEAEMNLLLNDVSKQEKNGVWVFLKLDQVKNSAYNTEAWGKAFGTALGKLRARIKGEPANPLIGEVEDALKALHGDDESSKKGTLIAVLGEAGSETWRNLDDNNLTSLAFILRQRKKA